MQAVADNGIGGGASSLTKDMPGFGEADNVVNGQKIVFVRELGDQVELPVNPGLNGLGYTIRPA